MDTIDKRLDRQATITARQFMGQVAWPTVGLALAVVGAFIATLWSFALGGVPLLWATLAASVLGYLAYTPIHEAAHGNIRGGEDRYRWLEDLCGYACAQVFFLPYAGHRHEHMAHHRYTNQPDRDPDFLASEMSKGLLGVILVTPRFYWNLFTFAVRKQCRATTRRDRVAFYAETIIGIVWRAAFVAYVGLFDGLVLILGSYLVAVYFTVYWFAYRPHHPYDKSARYKNTSNFVFPKWLAPARWFWMGQDIHAIHHLFPRVPFYRYRRLYAQIEPVLEAQGTPLVGLLSRERLAYPD